MKRERVPFYVSRVLGGRPVRWSDPGRVAESYDGRARTLQVFNADAKEQRRLLAEIDRHKKVLEAAVDGPLVVIFHSRKQSQERHAAFIHSFPKPVSASVDVAPSPDKCEDEAVETGPHLKKVAA
jgi:hypothetical protein